MKGSQARLGFWEVWGRLGNSGGVGARSGGFRGVRAMSEGLWGSQIQVGGVNAE